MSERDRAYRHEAAVTVAGSSGERPSAEHRATAAGDAPERGDPTPHRRACPDGYGPRTHDGTQVAGKDGG